MRQLRNRKSFKIDMSRAVRPCRLQGSNSGWTAPFIRGELRDLRLAIDKIPLREYSEHLATGRRCLADLRDWRTPKERTRLLNEARTAFRAASGIARVQQDTERELVAELAMAGCWYAESALDDVRATLRAACELAESDVLRAERG